MQRLKKPKGEIATFLLYSLANVSLVGDSEQLYIWSFGYEEPALQCLAGDPVQEEKTWEREEEEETKNALT